jgi:hypothetical protein
MLVEIQLEILNTFEVAARLFITSATSWLSPSGDLFLADLLSPFLAFTCVHLLQQAFAAATVGDLGAHALYRMGSPPPVASHLRKVLGLYAPSTVFLRSLEVSLTVTSIIITRGVSRRAVLHSYFVGGLIKRKMIGVQAWVKSRTLVYCLTGQPLLPLQQQGLVIRWLEPELSKGFMSLFRDSGHGCLGFVPGAHGPVSCT